jgi:hypothetical protein
MYVWVLSDTAILVSRKFPNTVSELLQGALCVVCQGCDRTQLSINPQKMVMVAFSRKRLRGLKDTTPSGQGTGMDGTAEKCDE